MCKIGDIILVKKYVSHGVELGKHSFVVLNADNGEIQGLPYDLVCNVMSCHLFIRRNTRKENCGSKETSKSARMMSMF